MKKVLFVMSRLPFPKTSGRKTSLYHYCEIIHNLGYKLIVASFLEDGDDVEERPYFLDQLIVLPKAGVKEKLFNIFESSFVEKNKPLQVGLFWSKEAKKIIDNLIRSQKPDIVIADMVRTTEYLKDSECFKIADLDDLISLRYERQFESNIEGINPYGAYLNSIPVLLQRILLDRRIKGYIVKKEIRLLKQYELAMARRYDKTIFVAEGEAERINRCLAQSDRAVAIPIGVDIEYFGEKMPRCNLEQPYICFLGHMSVAHNENGVLHFVKYILPLIRAEVPDIKFLVIGGGVTAALKAHESDFVQFTGRVADVRTYLQNGKVFVCPLKFGSGIKTKNLEAMASGLPVVTTVIGAENIGATDNKDWLVATSDQDFSDKVIKLLKDENRRIEIAESGRNYVTQNWTWEYAKMCLFNILPTD